jgi:hypothetical protein
VKRQSTLAALNSLSVSDPENDRTIIKQPKARWCGAPLRALQWNVQYKFQKINGLCRCATHKGDKKAASGAASFWCVL